MTSTDLIPATLLARKAVVYVGQSTQSQVMTNLESQRRQYDLVDVARQRGFGDIEVIDDDLGRSASQTVARPGFDRLVALLCAGKVGAVLCFDAGCIAYSNHEPPRELGARCRHKTEGKCVTRKLKAVCEGAWRHMHAALATQHKWLAAALREHYG